MVFRILHIDCGAVTFTEIESNRHLDTQSVVETASTSLRIEAPRVGASEVLDVVAVIRRVVEVQRLAILTEVQP